MSVGPSRISTHRGGGGMVGGLWTSRESPSVSIWPAKILGGSHGHAREEHEAPRAPRNGRLRELRRRHGATTHPRQATRALDRARVGAEERYRARRDEPEKAEPDHPDRPRPRAYALELARHGRRPARGRVSDARARYEARRLRDLRLRRPHEAEVSQLLRLLGPEVARRPSPLVGGRRVRPHRIRSRGLPPTQPEGRPVLPDHRCEGRVAPARGGALVAARHARG